MMIDDNCAQCLTHNAQKLCIGRFTVNSEHTNVHTCNIMCTCEQLLIWVKRLVNNGIHDFGSEELGCVSVDCNMDGLINGEHL